MNTFFQLVSKKISHSKQNFDKKILIVFMAGILLGYGYHLLTDKEDGSPHTTNQIKGAMAEKQHFDIYEFIKQGFQNEKAGISWTVLAEDQTSGIQLVSIKDQMPNHIHKTEDHYTYVVSGTGDYIQAGKTIALSPGIFISTPMKTPHRIINKGDEPLLFLVFSSPLPFREDDIEWLKNP